MSARPRAAKSAKTRPVVVALTHDPVDDAKAAALRYVSDERPGITRRRAGKGSQYRDAEGRIVKDAATLDRIRKLAIPPAWTEVWICPLAAGHLQATGRDARGRKQYRYHERWREVRDEAKYERMLAFAAALPRIRRRVSRDLRSPGVSRTKVLASLIRLLETTLIRVGNEEYARANQSFGLTTLRNRHADVRGDTIRFHFRGKSGKQHDVEVTDRRVARVIRRCQELPGHELFEYADESGQVQSIGSADVNEYLREITGEEFTAKDFRTWAGTIFAAQTLAALGPSRSMTQGKKTVVEAIQQVAKRLGNTPAICRKCYVHPAIVEAYLDGSLLKLADNGQRTAVESQEPKIKTVSPRRIEDELRKFLEERLRSTTGESKAG